MMLRGVFSVSFIFLEVKHILHNLELNSKIIETRLLTPSGGIRRAGIRYDIH